jgi:hypothetical protein
MEDKIKTAQSICTCFSILDLPEQSGEGSLHGEALAVLRKNHIHADRKTQDRFRAELSEEKKQAAALEERYGNICNQIAHVKNVQEISERVESDDPIIALKK